MWPGRTFLHIDVRAALPAEGDPRRAPAWARLKYILRAFTDRVDVLGFGEALLDVSRPAGVDAWAEARAVQAAVRVGTGLSCAVGAAATEAMARLAGGLGKPDGVTVIPPDMAADILARTPVGALDGVGPQERRALAALGVATAGDLGRLPPETLYARFGEDGHRLWMLGRGRAAPWIGLPFPMARPCRAVAAGRRGAAARRARPWERSNDRIVGDAR